MVRMGSQVTYYVIESVRKGWRMGALSWWAVRMMIVGDGKEKRLMSKGRSDWMNLLLVVSLRSKNMKWTRTVHSGMSLWMSGTGKRRDSWSSREETTGQLLSSSKSQFFKGQNLKKSLGGEVDSSVKLDIFYSIFLNSGLKHQIIINVLQKTRSAATFLPDIFFPSESLLFAEQSEQRFLPRRPFGLSVGECLSPQEHSFEMINVSIFTTENTANFQHFLNSILITLPSTALSKCRLKPAPVELSTLRDDLEL